MSWSLIMLGYDMLWQFPFPPRGGKGSSPSLLGGGEGGSSQREEPVGARHAWLAWPWASQAITHERFRVPTVLATRVPWACEWAVGCARGRRALAHRSVERASVFIGCVGHLLSLTAGGEDSTCVLGRGRPQRTPSGVDEGGKTPPRPGVGNRCGAQAAECEGTFLIHTQAP